jgi:hypothetical protein
MKVQALNAPAGELLVAKFRTLEKSKGYPRLNGIGSYNEFVILGLFSLLFKPVPAAWLRSH